jgi:hypothetical protein
MSLYRVPEAFEERLKEEFGDRLRVRWSNKYDEWHVEQQVRRGLAGFPQGQDQDRFDDNLIRYADGYMWIMSIKQGSRFSCHLCHLPLEAPTRKLKMVSCEHCKRKGYDHYRMACFWPFDETLIDELKRLEHGMDAMAQKTQAKNELLQQQQLRAAIDPTLDAHLDDFHRVVGNPQAHLSGRTQMWQE